MKTRLSIIVVLGVVASAAMADIRPAGLFTDNMVIQRETEAAVWGWGDAGEKVTVSGSWGASAKTTVDDAGKWAVTLQTPAAGGPHTLTLEGKNTIALKNVLSGDVWLCSGQSNMQWPVSKALNPDDEAERATHPQIRHFAVGRKPAPEETADCTGAWTVCSPETVLDYSATAYFTGRELHTSLGVPIGLLVSCWGGTCVEAWTPLAEQTKDRFAQQRQSDLDKRAKAYTPEGAQASFERQLKGWEKKAAAAKAQKKRAPRRPRLQTDPRLNHNYPGNLYNGMIHPLLSYAIKGAIWYQGEANAKTLASAQHYRVQLDRMIRSWRTHWGQDIPFYAVQLPNFKDAQKRPVETDDIWPLIRESFTYVAQNTPAAFTCTTIDLGEAKNIHPKNKQGVGQRLGSTILNKTYGKDTPTTPFMTSFAIEGNTGVITFDYNGSGLMAKGGALKGFAMAGADQIFVWADASIVQRDGVDCVEVRAAEIKEPIAVRYGWADNPEDCNLYSREGFPASPFRSDVWAVEDTPVAPADGKDAKRTLRSRLTAGESLTVVTYGTSLTRVGAWVDQVGTVLEQNYPGQVTVINSAQGGSNSDWGLKAFEEKVIAKEPDTVFIEFAINDSVASRKTSVAHSRNNLEIMIDQLLKARPACEIILMAMNPPVAEPGVRRPDVAEYYQMYRDVAGERGLQLIDHYPVWDALLNSDPGRFLQYMPDGIHPVREGALQIITPTILKALGLTQGKPEQSSASPCWDYVFRMMDKEVQRDRKVTREEYDLFWTKGFTKLDADANGVLMPDEYAPTVLFKHIDADDDGKVTLKEYLGIYAPHFDKRDKNTDGTLDDTER